MALQNKIPLPDAYIEEMQEYVRIGNKPLRTTSGQATFTNTRTSATYTTLGSAYDNQGEEGLALLLYNVSPKLIDYIFDDASYIEIKTILENLGNESPYTSANESTLNYTAGVLTSVVDNISGVLYKLTTLNYTAGVLTSINTKIYESDGITISYEYIETLNYTSGTLTSVDRTVI